VYTGRYFCVKMSNLLLTAIPVQALTDPYGFRGLRLPGFLDIWHMKVARL
jgi:hypothetical protein